MSVPASPFSVAVGAANSALAVFLRARAEEESLLPIGRHRIRDVLADIDKNAGRSRWTTPPRFSRPSSLVGRSPLPGMRPFHFAYQSISQPLEAADHWRQIHGSTLHSATPAGDHSNYIEREGAPEVHDQDEYARYIERRSAVERGEPAWWDPAVPLGLINAVGGPLSIISNISDDAGERQEFWKLVEKHEPKPKTASLCVKPERNLDWWERALAGTAFSPDFHKFLAEEHNRYNDHVEKRVNEEFKPKLFKGPIKKLARIYDRATTLTGWTEQDSPLLIHSGRAGRTQLRMVAELPADIRPEDRLDIVREFCRGLERIETNEKGDWVGMMYTAVIHAPDPGKSDQNYHMHLVAYDRPCDFMSLHYEWDFAIQETYKRRGEIRTHYPYRQNKLVTVSQSKKVTNSDGTGRDYVAVLRRQFADCVNVVMTRKGKAARFHPGSYRSLGIDRRGTMHLGKVDWASEEIGIATDAGSYNADIIFGDMDREIRTRLDREERAFRDTLTQSSSLILDDAGPAPDIEVISLHDEMERLIVDVFADRLELELFHLSEKRARSRAEVVRNFCDDHLEGSGKENRRSVAEADALCARRDLAAQWLHNLDHALAESRRQLMETIPELEGRKTRLDQAEARLRVLLGARQSVGTDVEKATPTTDGAAAAGQPGGEPQTRWSERPLWLQLEDEAEAHRHRRRLEASRPPEAPVASAEITTLNPGGQSAGDLGDKAPAGLGSSQPEVPDPSEMPAKSLSETARASGEAAKADSQPFSDTKPRQLGEAKAPPVTPSTGQKKPVESEAEKAFSNSSHQAGNRAVTGATGDHKQKSSGAGGREILIDLEMPKTGKFSEQTKSDYSHILKKSDRVTPAAMRDIGSSEVIGRISRDRIEIVREDAGNGFYFTVPSLSVDEREILREAHPRTQLRLSGIWKNQRHEVDRLVKWLSKHVRSPINEASVNNALARDSKAPKTIYENWKNSKTLMKSLKSLKSRKISEELGSGPQKRLESPTYLSPDKKSDPEEAKAEQELNPTLAVEYYKSKSSILKPNTGNQESFEADDDMAKGAMSLNRNGTRYSIPRQPPSKYLHRMKKLDRDDDSITSPATSAGGVGRGWAHFDRATASRSSGVTGAARRSEATRPCPRGP